MIASPSFLSLASELASMVIERVSNEESGGGAESVQKGTDLLDASGLFRGEEDADHTDRGQAAHCGDGTPPQLIDKDEVGIQLLRQRNGLRLSGVQVPEELRHACAVPRCLDANERGGLDRKWRDTFGRVLKLTDHRRRHDDLAKLRR